MCRRLVLLYAALGAACLAAPGAAAEPAKPTAADLDAAKRKVFSQYTEDGVIEKIFDTIEPTQEYVVEFGSHNGVKNSNARNLIVNHDWRALLLEGDEKLAQAAIAAYRGNPRVKAAHAWVYPGNVEMLFEEHGVPGDLDLLVIDIDSNDYYVWRAIHDFRPKVVMIEVNILYPPPQLMIVAFHPMNYWDGSAYLGASLQSLDNMAKRKGYELLYCMPFGPNCFWVDKPYFELFDIPDNSPAKVFRMWNAPRGPLEYAPEDTLHWDAFEIPKRLILDR